MSKGPTLSNIAWIAAIVLVLTFLIVVVAWMSSGKLKVENPETPRNSEVAEKTAEPSVFIPEQGDRAPQKEAPAKEPPVQISNLTPEASPAPVAEKPPLAAAVQQTQKEMEEPPAKEPARKEPETKPAEPSGSFALQLGAFSSAENARAFEKRLASKGYATTLRSKGSLTAVLITGIKSSEEAQKLKEKLARENIKASIVPNP